MNALPMNSFGTFDPRDAMERWHQQQQQAQQNALMPGGGSSISAGPAMPFGMPGAMPPMPGSSVGAMPGTIPPMPGSSVTMPRLPFGGFRAKGGPVRPGMAYVVGEKGPELMVPSTPGTIVPNSALNPVNGRPVPAGSMPQTMPGQGAPMPPMRPSTGMLVAGPGGSTKWQPGTGPGTTLPPMTAPSLMPARPPMPFSMPTMAASPMPFGNGSRIAQAPQNRPYAELAGGTGSMANSGTRPIGRSANDPTRIAEQMRRWGDPRAIMQLGMQQMGQNFARERDAVNFAQSQMMFGQQQQAMDARDAGTGMPVPPPMDEPMPDLPANAAPMEPAAPPMSFEQAFQQSPLGLSGPPPMSTTMQVPFDTPPEMMGKLNQGAFAGVYGRAPAPVATMPIPGTDYVTPIFNGKPSSQTLPVKPSGTTGYAPVQGVPGLMVPTGPGADKLPPMQQTPNPGWSVTGQPKTRMQPVGEAAAPKAPSGIQYTYDAAGNVTGGFYPRYNPATGRFVISKLDLDGDGVPDAQQGGAGAGAGAAKVPAWKSLMQ